MDDPLDHMHPTPAAWWRRSELAPVFPAYWQYLADQQYADHTRDVYVCCVAHFARWLTRRRRTVCDLTDDDIRRFLDEHLSRCTCPPPVHRSRHRIRAALRHLFAVLRDAGRLVTPSVSDPVDDELHAFDDYMHRVRGLASNTRTQRLRILRPLLRDLAGSDGVAVPTLSANALRRFIAEQPPRGSSATARALAGALRSYLRFRIGAGDQVSHLLPVIVSPADWRLAPLPQVLSPIEVARLLAAFSPDVPSARRDYAMVRCAVDLGLRANEVACLDLDDIDWSAGTIRIGSTKSRRVDVLPLPQATSRAIAAYLRSERPRTAHRRVFIRQVAPVDKPISSAVVRHAIRAAYRRAELPHTRVHLLRHTLASRLLANGGTLKEVADVLRHRALDTSLIYAKVDTAHLSAVALPWPGSAP